MIFLILAIIGLTVLGLDRIENTIWAFLDVVHSTYTKLTNK